MFPKLVVGWWWKISFNVSPNSLYLGKMSMRYAVNNAFGLKFMFWIDTEIIPNTLDVLNYKGNKYLVIERHTTDTQLTAFKLTPKCNVHGAINSKKPKDMNPKEKAISYMEEERYKAAIQKYLPELCKLKNAMVVVHFKKANIPNVKFAYSIQYLNIPEDLKVSLALCW